MDYVLEVANLARVAVPCGSTVEEMASVAFSAGLYTPEEYDAVMEVVEVVRWGM